MLASGHPLLPLPLPGSAGAGAGAGSGPLHLQAPSIDLSGASLQLAGLSDLSPSLFASSSSARSPTIGLLPPPSPVHSLGSPSSSSASPSASSPGLADTDQGQGQGQGSQHTNGSGARKKRKRVSWPSEAADLCLVREFHADKPPLAVAALRKVVPQIAYVSPPGILSPGTPHPSLTTNTYNVCFA
jgi:hypothetical protein